MELALTDFPSNSLAILDIENLVHPQTNARLHLEKGPRVIVGAEGTTLFDSEGREFIDCISAMWCCPIGFKSERLGRVAMEQLSKLGFYHIYKHHSHETAIRLAEKIISTLRRPMSKVIYQNSGSEANEVALKLCWYHANATGRPEKRKMIGRLGGFHGQTTATSSLSGRNEFHRGFNLPVDGFLYTSSPHYYRMHEAGETEEQFSDRMAEDLEKLILAEGPETIAGMFAEPVMGANGGVTPPRTYFEKIQKVLKKHDILFVADEVITGVGRTGNWWATDTYGLEPDIITSAKGLGAGMVPIGAAIVSDRIHQTIMEMSDRLGVYAQGSTFSGNPLATAMALETLTIIEEEDLIANGRALGKLFLDAISGDNDHPMLADVRSVGALTSAELMKDRGKRIPFDASENALGVLGKHCDNEGVAVRLNSNRVIFAPALNMTMDEAEEAIRRFHRALDATWKDLSGK